MKTIPHTLITKKALAGIPKGTCLGYCSDTDGIFTYIDRKYAGYSDSKLFELNFEDANNEEYFDRVITDADKTPHPIAKVIIMILFIIAMAAFLLPMAIAFAVIFLPLFLLSRFFVVNHAKAE